LLNQIHYILGNKTEDDEIHEINRSRMKDNTEDHVTEEETNNSVKNTQRTKLRRRCRAARHKLRNNFK